MGALLVVVICLSRSGHQPAGSQDEVSTCTLRKHLVVFIEGTEGGLENRHELPFKAANRVAASTCEASTMASTARCSSKIWGSARMAAIATSSVRAAAICFSAAKCSLRSWLYCVHHG